MNISLEIERNGVTVAEFLGYIKRRCAEKGVDWIDIDRDLFENSNQNLGRSYYVKDGIKHATVTRKCRNEKTGGIYYDCVSTDWPGEDAAAAAETSREFPLEWQTYVLNFDGSAYNEICEFTFDDDKRRRGHGYFYLLNKDAEAVA
jgi:hypothetical protein